MVYALTLVRDSLAFEFDRKAVKSQDQVFLRVFKYTAIFNGPWTLGCWLLAVGCWLCHKTVGFNGFPDSKQHKFVNLLEFGSTWWISCFCLLIIRGMYKRSLS